MNQLVWLLGCGLLETWNLTTLTIMAFVTFQAAEMDNINNSFFDDLPDIVDIITALPIESARV